MHSMKYPNHNLAPNKPFSDPDALPMYRATSYSCLFFKILIMGIDVIGLCRWIPPIDAERVASMLLTVSALFCGAPVCPALKFLPSTVLAASCGSSDAFSSACLACMTLQQKSIFAVCSHHGSKFCSVMYLAQMLRISINAARCGASIQLSFLR